MPLSLGRLLYDKASHCVDPQDKLQSLGELLDALGNPFPDPDGTLEIVFHNSDDDTIVNQNGDVITITGGASLVVEDEGVSLGPFTTMNFVGDGVEATDGGGGTVIVTVGSTPGSSQDVFKNVAVSGGDSSGGPCVADSATDTLNLAAAVGFTLTAVAGTDTITLTPTVAYVEIKGQSTAAYTPTSGTGSVDNVVAINGVSPVTMSSDTITFFTEVDVYCANNDILYLSYTLEGAGLSSNWSCANMKNLRPILAGLGNYDPTKNMLLGHPANGTVASQQEVSWKSVSDWLKTLPSYSASGTWYIRSVGGTIAWVQAQECS